MKTKIFKAFTLIELLIVIVIIGILATALIPRVTGMQDRARYARVEKDFRDFRTAVFLAQSNTNKSLFSITSSDCTHCSCGTGDLRKIGDNDSCRTDRIGALRKIENAAGMGSGTLAGLETDPRGSPYIFDENDRFGTCFLYGNDLFNTIHTVGPNGFKSGISTSNTQSTTGDNRGIDLPIVGCNGAY